jgi:hypothetical protein
MELLGRQMKRTTTDLVAILGVTSKSVIQIANRERWGKIANVGSSGMHLYDVSDAQLRIYFDKKEGKIAERTHDHYSPLAFLQSLIDGRICAVSFKCK